MSNAHSENLRPEPSDTKVFFSALAWVGAILIFGVIVLIAYGPNQGLNPYDAGADERTKIKTEVFAAQEKLATQYQWADQAAGKVRIPLDRAKELTLADLQASNAAKLAANPAQ